MPINQLSRTLAALADPTRRSTDPPFRVRGSGERTGSRKVGETPKSSKLGIDAGGRVDQRHGDQGDAEVSDLDEHPVQFRLVRNDTGETRRSIVFLGQGEVTEPGRPVLVQVPIDPKVVGGRRLSLVAGVMRIRPSRSL